ncbi:DUF2690 domain-containing protein [Actinomycetospora sp. NBRC 106378]|uniref:DUF2690 domain-containing protein n=1 Tax=Actinomycetospora sp. NBRC 106378 TaxID=3032208 RepID=UPI0024A57117|nr:DUF2690 domain-containing protein [Actinomycetospora sp. NBRC 106378]GLZ51716.1 hypothetical protein Acsp07_13330 [Actinomycetospora sp. NBRC 106378]
MTLTTPARRSAPESFATTALPSTMTAPFTAAVTAPSRRRVWLGGLAALGLVGAIGAVALGSGATPVAPLPAARDSLVGADPSTSRCADDAQTVTSRVVTTQRGRLEVPIGMLEVRASGACGTAWARYTLDASAPVAEVAIEGGTRQELPVVASGRVVHGVTSMIMADGPVHAVVVPVDGAVLPSRSTAGGTP